jgi:hypothetical protein
VSFLAIVLKIFLSKFIFGFLRAKRANKSGQYNNDNGKNLIYFWDQIPIPQKKKGGAITLLLFSDLESMFSHFHFSILIVLNFCTQKKKKKKKTLKEFLILEFKENK